MDQASQDQSAPHAQELFPAVYFRASDQLFLSDRPLCFLIQRNDSCLSVYAEGAFRLSLLGKSVPSSPQVETLPDIFRRRGRSSVAGYEENAIVKCDQHVRRRRV